MGLGSCRNAQARRDCAQAQFKDRGHGRESRVRSKYPEKSGIMLEGSRGKADFGISYLPEVIKANGTVGGRKFSRNSPSLPDGT
jgi:hypothetical protein